MVAVLYHAHMTEQLSLIMLVVALATGLITSIVAAAYMQARQPVFFRFFLTNILLFNLLILAGLVFRYLQFQLQAPELQSYLIILPGLLVVMAALKLGWLYAFILMNKTLPADIAPKQSASSLIRVAVVVFLGYLAVITASSFTQSHSLQQAAIIFLETLIICGALFATLRLILNASKLPKDKRRRSILVFGGYHLGLMGVILVVLVLGWLQPGPQRLVQLLANGGFLILFNLFPLIWMRWFQPLQPVSRLERFESLGISKREREIIALIQTGKTNQEIADELFISVATIKDHNHNIFRKCKVRNRLELAKLFQ
jgi:DNA-binding CsgD family transcriptional regulator